MAVIIVETVVVEEEVDSEGVEDFLVDMIPMVDNDPWSIEFITFKK